MKRIDLVLGSLWSSTGLGNIAEFKKPTKWEFMSAGIYKSVEPDFGFPPAGRSEVF